MRHIMDFKVATLLKSSSGNKKLENVNASFEVEWSERNCHIDGTVLLTKTDVGIWVSAHLKANYIAECGSCLEEYKESIPLEIEEEYFPLLNLLTGERIEIEEIIEENFYIQEDNVLDLSEAASQYLSLQSPINSKCEEDCSGLCIDCGVNLNMKECGCGNNTRNTKIAALLEPFKISE